MASRATDQITKFPTLKLSNLKSYEWAHWYHKASMYFLFVKLAKISEDYRKVSRRIATCFPITVEPDNSQRQRKQWNCSSYQKFYWLSYRGLIFFDQLKQGELYLVRVSKSFELIYCIHLIENEHCRVKGIRELSKHDGDGSENGKKQ